MKMIGSDYVLEAHNIFHTTEASALESVLCLVVAIEVFCFALTGGRWRLLQWSRQFSAGAQRRQSHCAQRRGDGYFGFEG